MTTELFILILIFVLGFVASEILRNKQNKKRIQKRKTRAGEKGEDLVKRLLTKKGIPHKQGLLFELGINNTKEIDFVAMTSDKDLLIIEVKNWKQDHSKNGYTPFEQNERHTSSFKKLLMVMKEEHRPKRFLDIHNIVVFVGDYQPEYQDNHFNLKTFAKYLDKYKQETTHLSETFIKNLDFYDLSTDKRAMKQHIKRAKRARKNSRLVG